MMPASTIRIIGRHRVRHGDVTDRNGIAKLMSADMADIMYSDPPWGDGNIKFWATLNRKMNGHINQPAPLDDFLSAVFSVAKTYVSRYLLVEYGVRWADLIQSRGAAAGFVSHGIVKLRYRAGAKLLPLDLHLFARPGEAFPVGYEAPIVDTYGYTTNQRAIGPLAEIVKRSKQNAIIVDPCCGMGYTAQAACDYGMAFRGNELNAKRLSKTIARLQRDTAGL